MATLRIPDAGLLLESSPRSKDSLPLQAFGIVLDNSMIEDMIRSVQSGQHVELTLGNSPSFHYGSREEKISALPESFDFDLYLTNPMDPGSKTQRLPHPTMSLLKKPPQALSTKKVTKVTTKHASRASSSGVDSDADTRASSNAQKGGKGPKSGNGGTKGAKRLPNGRSAIATVFSSTTRLPTSPSLNGISSPNPAITASQQVLEKNKGQRSVLVHELAVRDRSFEHLKDVWTGADADLKPTVEKVADFNKTTEKWSLKKIYWKELDVWNYDYDNPDERQSAIDNAIKVYDKQRVVLSDDVWDRLLPREDRNKNIVLSKLQATIAKQSTAAPAPKISVQKAEDGNKSDIDTSKAKGEPMSRSNSQPVASKPKKISERDAQTKRLLSNNPKKPAPKKPVNKVKAVEEKGKRFLSEEFVYDTETSDEEAPLSQSAATSLKPKLPQKPAAKPAEKPEKPVGKVNEKPKEPPVPPVSLKPKPKPVVRPPRAPVKTAAATTKPSQKRSREDEESSSSSGAPLMKRMKPKELPKPVPDPKSIKHRASDASQNSRGTNGTVSSSFTMKSKNTSPTKSSPLATSPPTNASDLDERPATQRPPIQSRPRPRPPQQYRSEERDRVQPHGAINGISTSNSTTPSIVSTTIVSKKRREREPVEESPDTTPTPPTKKARVSKEILIKARKFAEYYKKYENLHHEIVALRDPPGDKLADLLEMHERLSAMKRDIYQATGSES
ncbi:putative com1 regulatory protein [Rosellinia necatrix]|uniref:Putative com1 regulatory protein n=1 Tax=Rosellinia necatrix TaxID=77044 RepID=A0A1S7ULV9_ROSNE|nr:putative com1 regulatory protein [Rosellinia necatrix]